MAKSLQQQLLEAGAVDKSRATKLKKAKHKQAKQRSRGSAPPDEVTILAQQAQAEKIDRDRELSRQSQLVLEKKALAAQVRQLIEMNSITREAGDIAYNFSVQGAVKKIHINREQQSDLSSGRIAVARLDDIYVLIPSPVARKIAERAPDAVLVLNSGDGRNVEVDDSYADYKIPDDLTW